MCTEKRPLLIGLRSFAMGPQEAAKVPPMAAPKAVGEEGAVRPMRVRPRLPPPWTAPVMPGLPPWKWTVAQRELGRCCLNGPRR